MTFFVDAGRSPGGDLPLSTVVPGVLAHSSVMIVDDTPDNVVLLERLLTDAGATDIRGFTDPRDAVAACADARPDLLLLDLHMPHLDGLAVMGAIQDLLPDATFLPVIVLTADITPDARHRVLAAGAKDFLTKPFNITEVVLRVRNLLETSVLYRRLEQQNVDLRAELEVQAAAEREVRAERQRRVQRIDAVLSGDALTMVYQPIVSIALGDGAVVGAEALARFATEPQRPPNVWFAEATEVGRGVDLELAAIGAAIRHLDDLPPNTFVSLNASPATAISPRLPELLAGTHRDRVVVELTEHDRVDDYDILVSALDDVRSLGVRVAVDDTGAGYASLEHILRLRADILKLDIALTRGIDQDPVRRSLAGALVAFARDIGSVIIAEGVENAGELDVLRALGVQWAQGYHLARPGPLPLPTRIGAGPVAPS